MFDISALTSESQILHEGIPVIKLTMTIPVVAGGKRRAARRINAFYGHIATAVEKHLRGEMLKRASEDFDEKIAKSMPFEPYRVKMAFDAEQTEDGKAMQVRRRLYSRAGGAEREYALTEIWNTRFGIPDKLKSEEIDYSSSRDIIDIS